MHAQIELKPYVMDGQLCDECHGVQCNGKPAPFFCGSVTCLQYFCEYCWATVHSFPGKQNHRPLMKDISADRARFNYQWFNHSEQYMYSITLSTSPVLWAYNHFSVYISVYGYLHSCWYPNFFSIANSLCTSLLALLSFILTLNFVP